MTASDTSRPSRQIQPVKLMRLMALEEPVDLDSWSKLGMESLSRLPTKARRGLDGERVIDVLHHGEMPHLTVIKEYGKRLEHRAGTTRERMKGSFLYQIATATMLADCYVGGALDQPIHGYTSGKSRRVARGYRITGLPKAAVVATLADLMEDRATPPAVMSILKRAYRNLTDPPAERMLREPDQPE